MENGLNKKVSIKDKSFNSQVITNDWYILKENEVDEYIKKDEIGILYTITNNDGTNPLEKSSSEDVSFYEKLALINQRSSELFHAEDESGQEFKTLFSQVEMGYDVSSHIKIMLIFRKPDSFKNLKVVFNDIIWGNGPIKHLFEKSDLESLPELIKTNYDPKNS